ncbi:MAG: class F sortase [Patescibacteria group bacterium]|jgi:LPXTG-site transpeptidase (sortase) family protein
MKLVSKILDKISIQSLLIFSLFMIIGGALVLHWMVGTYSTPTNQDSSKVAPIGFPQQSPNPTPNPTPTPIPVKLIIPTLNIDTEIVPVGYVPETQEMEVPSNAAHVGWYRYGTPPGQKGSAVLSGHYDTPTGAPAIFYNLKNLQEGDQFFIVNNVGMQHLYTVKEVINVPLDGFPQDKIYGDRKEPQVSLITCSGVWNPQIQLYSHRLAVIAEYQESSRFGDLAALTRQPEQFLIQPFENSVLKRALREKGTYLRLEEKSGIIAAYLATEKNDVTAVDVVVSYNPMDIKITPERIVFGDFFEVYHVSLIAPGQIRLSLFTDPSRKAKLAVNSQDKEIKIAEIYYEGQRDFEQTTVDIVSDTVQNSSKVLTPVPGRDIHEGQNILEYTKGIVLTP